MQKYSYHKNIFFIFAFTPCIVIYHMLYYISIICRVVVNMKIQESGENYLETILNLERRNGVVRSVDIANALGFSKPSVSRAMGILRKAGLIEQEAYGNITLTESGRQRASDVFHRHTLITQFLIHVLSVDPQIAEQDACRIEHVISPETLEKMQTALDHNNEGS